MADNEDKKDKILNGVNHTISMAGAAGTGLQNFMGVGQVIQYFMGEVYALSDAGKGIAHSTAAAIGGMSSVFINYLLNVELIGDFFTRLKRLWKRYQLRQLRKQYEDELARLAELRELRRIAELQQGQLTAEQLTEKQELKDKIINITNLKREIREEFIKGLEEDVRKGFTKNHPEWKRVPRGLTGWKRVVCWIGIAAFIVSGLLYGLISVAVAPEGALAIMGIIAGLLVTPIQTIQELEVWVDSLDSLRAKKDENASNLTKSIGMALSIATVLVLSAMFTLGMAAFLISFCGVAAVPALAAAVAVAFTVGAFTEFFFYAPFLMGFCNSVTETMKDFKESKNWGLGILVVGLNAVSNGVVAGFAIGLLIGVMVTAGAAVPPFGAVLAVAVIAGLIAATASFMLGTKFWVRKFGNPKTGKGDAENAPLLDEGRLDKKNQSTDAYVANHSQRQQDTLEAVGEAPVDPTPTTTLVAVDEAKISTSPRNTAGASSPRLSPGIGTMFSQVVSSAAISTSSALTLTSRPVSQPL